MQRTLQEDFTQVKETLEQTETLKKRTEQDYEAVSLEQTEEIEKMES